MVMSSLEFKQICVGFGGDMQRVSEDLFSAIEGDLPLDEIPAAVAAGKQKLSDYDSALEQLDEVKRSQFVERFGEETETLREYLGQMDEQSSPSDPIQDS